MSVNRPIAIAILATSAAAVALATSFAAATQPATAAAPSGVAARVGSQVVSMADVDARWKRDAPVEYSTNAETQYEARRKALEGIVGDLLIDSAASSRGLTREQFVDLELAQRVHPVQERDVAAFYAANTDVLGNEPIDAHRERLQAELERRARSRAYNSLVAELAAARTTIHVLLEPPRQALTITDFDPAVGGDDAPVTIVTFSDFQCPFCARVEPTLKEIHAAYGDRVRIVWKDFPLQSIHPDALKAAEASHCAAEQEQYWAYHDRLFERQDRLNVAALTALAGELGLDGDRFTRCLASSRHASRIQESIEEGRRLGVEATPTLFVNGRAVRGAQPLQVFAEVIDDELARRGSGK